MPAVMIPERTEAAPARAEFAEFPLRLGEWSGRHERLEEAYINELKFTDYLLADYRREGTDIVNLYVAYYASQRKGESAHSPKGCLPGGGWVIEKFGRQQVPGVSVDAQPLSVNRAVISRGDERQLVYYWFQQRGRVITNEYLVKWFLFWDSLTRNRTDGALVRLITPVGVKSDTESADGALQEFARAAELHLPAYVPD